MEVLIPPPFPRRHGKSSRSLHVGILQIISPNTDELRFCLNVAGAASDLASVRIRPIFMSPPTMRR